MLGKRHRQIATEVCHLESEFCYQIVPNLRQRLLLERAFESPRRPRPVPSKPSPVLETVTRVLERADHPLRASEIHAEANALLGAVIFPVLGLACFILWLYLLISAYQGKMVMLPIIGPLALKQANG